MAMADDIIDSMNPDAGTRRQSCSVEAFADSLDHDGVLGMYY